MANTDNIKVVIKVRPLIKREKDKMLSSQWSVQDNTLESTNPLVTARFQFGKSPKNLFFYVTELVMNISFTCFL